MSEFEEDIPAVDIAKACLDHVYSDKTIGDSNYREVQNIVDKLGKVANEEWTGAQAHRIIGWCQKELSILSHKPVEFYMDLDRSLKPVATYSISNPIEFSTRTGALRFAEGHGYPVYLLIKGRPQLVNTSSQLDLYMESTEEVDGPIQLFTENPS